MRGISTPIAEAGGKGRQRNTTSPSHCIDWRYLWRSEPTLEGMTHTLAPLPPHNRKVLAAVVR